MKGVIFTELVAFMERAQSPEFVDELLVDAALPNDGAFTSVGNYPSEYALQMVTLASEKTGIEAAELCRLFGNYLYQRFMTLYPDIMAEYQSAEDLLAHVGSHIHTEVCILYPDARPPVIKTSSDDGDFIVHYESHRPMAAIAFGLVQGCMQHFDDPRDLVWDAKGSGNVSMFRLKAAAKSATVQDTYSQKLAANG